MTQHNNNIFNYLFSKEEQSSPKLLIFDIDSTLVHVHKRNQAILEDFFNQSHQQIYSHQYNIVKKIQFKKTDWGLREVFSKFEWPKNSEDFFIKIKSHWKKHFFSNNYLKYDILVPGALDFLTFLDKDPFSEIWYLTGRHKKTMLQGTIDYFNNQKIPFIKENLILKPEAQWLDTEFKSDEVKKLLSRGKKTWLFENEPTNINVIQKNFPEVTNIFLKTTHSRQSPEPENIISINNFLLD